MNQLHGPTYNSIYRIPYQNNTFAKSFSSRQKICRDGNATGALLERLVRLCAAAEYACPAASPASGPECAYAQARRIRARLRDPTGPAETVSGEKLL